MVVSHVVNVIIIELFILIPTLHYSEIIYVIVVDHEV